MENLNLFVQKIHSSFTLDQRVQECIATWTTATPLHNIAINQHGMQWSAGKQHSFFVIECCAMGCF